VSLASPPSRPAVAAPLLLHHQPPAPCLVAHLERRPRQHSASDRVCPTSRPSWDHHGPPPARAEALARSTPASARSITSSPPPGNNRARIEVRETTRPRAARPPVSCRRRPSRRFATTMRLRLSIHKAPYGTRLWRSGRLRPESRSREAARRRVGDAPGLHPETSTPRSSQSPPGIPHGTNMWYAIGLRRVPPAKACPSPTDHEPSSVSSCRRPGRAGPPQRRRSGRSYLVAQLSGVAPRNTVLHRPRTPPPSPGHRVQLVDRKRTKLVGLTWFPSLGRAATSSCAHRLVGNQEASASYTVADDHGIPSARDPHERPCTRPLRPRLRSHPSSRARAWPAATMNGTATGVPRGDQTISSELSSHLEYLPRRCAYALERVTRDRLRQALGWSP